MPKAYVPVNGEVVRWAIEESGRSLAEAAEKTKVDASRVQGWIGDVTAFPRRVHEAGGNAEAP